MGHHRVGTLQPLTVREVYRGDEVSWYVIEKCRNHYVVIESTYKQCSRHSREILWNRAWCQTSRCR